MIIWRAWLAVLRWRMRKNMQILGRCTSVSPRGYMCTVSEPHREHVTRIDGREVARWIDAMDRV